MKISHTFAIVPPRVQFLADDLYQYNQVQTVDTYDLQGFTFTPEENVIANAESKLRYRLRSLGSDHIGITSDFEFPIIIPILDKSLYAPI